MFYDMRTVSVSQWNITLLELLSKESRHNLPKWDFMHTVSKIIIFHDIIGSVIGSANKMMLNHHYHDDASYVETKDE